MLVVAALLSEHYIYSRGAFLATIHCVAGVLCVMLCVVQPSLTCNASKERVFALWKDSGSELCNVSVVSFLGHTNIRCPFSFLRARCCMHGVGDYFYLIIINVSNRNPCIERFPTVARENASPRCFSSVLHRGQLGFVLLLKSAHAFVSAFVYCNSTVWHCCCFVSFSAWGTQLCCRGQV